MTVHGHSSLIVADQPVVDDDVAVGLSTGTDANIPVPAPAPWSPLRTDSFSEMVLWKTPSGGADPVRVAGVCEVSVMPHSKGLRRMSFSVTRLS